MVLDHTNNSDFEDPDELDEDNDWETQQIRKAVTGSQLAAVQQESASMATMYNMVSHSMVPQNQQAMTSMSQKPRFPESSAYVPQRLMSVMDMDEIIAKSKAMYILM